jgi:hypothetical protein
VELAAGEAVCWLVVVSSAPAMPPPMAVATIAAAMPARPHPGRGGRG